MSSTIPKDFLLGVATAAYQIEGAWKADGKGESIWDRFSHTPGVISDQTTGDQACDHYHRWPEDIALMKTLGIDAYRFSIAWTRILPEGKGLVNQKGIDFYRTLIDGLLENGIQPVVTLYHWDLPQALQDRGGWNNQETVDAFEEYARILFQALGDQVSLWITHNEPWVSSFVGHYDGFHAPGIKDFSTALQVSRNLLLSHGRVLRVFRDEGIKGKLGITLVLYPVIPQTDRTEDRAAAHRLDGHLNRWFLDPLFRGQFPSDMVEWYAKKGYQVSPYNQEESALVSQPLDFLGVNYYFRNIVQAARTHQVLDLDVSLPAEAEVTEMGWEIYPPGIEQVIQRVGDEYRSLEMYITENGIALPDYINQSGRIDDQKRSEYVTSHLAALLSVRAAGYPVKGYFHWSLMDNFEWAYGQSKRFGLVYTDYSTQERIPKKSFYHYQDLIRTRQLPD